MVVCYLCRSDDFAPRSGTVRDHRSLTVVECVACGLVTLSSRDHIKAGHYEDSGMHGVEPPSIQSWLNETEQDDRRRFETLRPSIVNSRLLDFGCGAAGFLRLAATIAAQAEGVEPERRVHDHWAGALPLHRRLEDAGRDYNLITAFHVVEHLPDPRAMLVDLAARLAKGGRLVVEVPSADDALLTLYASEPFQRFTYWSQHLFLFNAETMRRLAVQAGLRVVAIEQFQRYPLSNHLHWLSAGRPGGHQRWPFIDTPSLTAAYAASLAAMGRCDTVIAHLERKAS